MLQLKRWSKRLVFVRRVGPGESYFLSAGLEIGVYQSVESNAKGKPSIEKVGNMRGIQTALTIKRSSKIPSTTDILIRAYNACLVETFRSSEHELNDKCHQSRHCCERDPQILPIKPRYRGEVGCLLGRRWLVVFIIG